MKQKLTADRRMRVASDKVCFGSMKRIAKQSQTALKRIKYVKSMRGVCMYEMVTEAICPLFCKLPARYARVQGSREYPQIEGMVFFHRFREGTIVIADIMGLPETESGIFGFHIHEGFSCTGNASDPFANTGGHFNPYEKPHPQHAGDMPVLFSNKGRAWCAFYTERFLPGEVAAKTVVIHDMPDDFHSQPAGDSGKKIACGKIV